MAYIKTSKTTGTEDAEATFTPDDMNCEVGDYILLVVLADLSAGGNVSIPTGYTEAIAQVNNITITACFYKQVTVQNEPMPELSKPTLNAMPWIVSSFIIADASASFIDAITTDFTTAGTQNSIISPQVTTTEDNCLVLRFINCQSGVAFTESEGVGNVIYETGLRTGVISITGNFNNQVSAGLSKPVTFNKNSGGRTTSITLAIGNAVGGKLECDVSDGIQYIHQHGLNQTSNVGGTDIVISGLVPTTIDGQPVVSTPASLSVLVNDDYTGTLTGVQTSSVPASGWFGFSMEMPVTNLLGKLVTLTYDTRTGQWLSKSVLYFEDSLGNYTLIANPNITPITRLVDFSSLPQVEGSVTPIDWTAISKYGIVLLKNNTATSDRIIEFKDFAIVDNDNAITLFGGNVSARTVSKAMRTGGDFNRSLSQGLSQDVLTIPFKIGNGVDKTVFNHQGASIETPSNLSGWNVSTGAIRYLIEASDNCIMDFSAGILAHTVEQIFQILPTSSLLATYNFETIFNNFRLEWLKGVECRGATFLNCGIIDTDGSDFVNCTFSQSTEPRGILLYDSGNITNCTFTKAGDDYAIEISEAGDYDLSDTEFIGYATDINVTAATGVVNITLSSGQATPTFITAGATVNFLQPQIALTIKNMPINYEYNLFIKDLDDDITIGAKVSESESHIGGDIVFTYEASNIDRILLIQVFDDATTKEKYRSILLGENNNTYILEL